MEPDFWRARWQERQIGFHQGAPNTYLQRHIGRLTGRVLVPLCGKTEDLAFLAARGHEVVGIELVESAVAEFFTDHSILPTVTRVGDFAVYVCAGITIVCGDFFATTRELVGRVDSIYDRAAMVALPPPQMRRRYVHHLRELTPHATTLLLVTLEVPDDPMTKPPFSVSEAAVRAEYADAPVELIDQGAAEERFVGGVERCYAIDLTAQRPPS